MNKKAVGIFAAACAMLFAGAAIVHAQDTTPPTVPTEVSAYVTQSGQVYVSWSPSSDNTGIIGYYLYRDSQLVANTPGLLFYTDNAPAGNHTYTAAAYDAANNISGQSLPSSVVTVVADTVAPTAPANFTLTPSSSSVALSWDASTDNVAVIGYYIYRNGQKLNLQNTIGGTTYTDTGLSPGISYSYQVGAYDAAGNVTRSISASVMTIFDVTPPSPPRSMSIKAISPSEINLSWTPATDNIAVVGYSVYRNSNFIGTSAGTTTAYQDSGLSPSAQYSYTVIAVDEVGNASMQSLPAAATTFPQDLTPPSIPSGLRFVSPSTSEIDLSWNSSTDNVGVTGYYVFRDGSEVGNVVSPSYADMYLTANTTYLYAVKAYDSSGNISPQQSIAATTPATNPIVPVTPPQNPYVPPVPVVTPPPVTPPPTTPPTGTNLPSYTFTAFLGLGSRGVAVQNLQLVLIAEGNLNAAYATGYFGALTQKALQQFQCTQGLVCSGAPSTTGYGSVGPRTRKVLNALTSGY
jgi:chitodextrinase